MWILFTLLILIYVSLFLFKIWYPQLSESIYEKYGFDIGLFQIKINFSARGRWISNISTLRRCKKFYKLGSIISLLLILPSTMFLVINLIKLLSMVTATTISEEATKSESGASTINIQKEDLIFQPIIPGVNFPWSDVTMYGFSLLTCTVFHEFGHALAADCQDIKILGYGLLIILIIPAAFVNLSTSELKSLSFMDQLKIYTAGVYHNLILTTLAFLFILALPYLLLPLYDKGSGVAITSLRPNSSVHGGASGLQEGQLIYQINECSVKNTSDFHSCLQQEQKKSGTPPHYCVHLEEQLICPDCCSETKDNNGSHLAFKVGSKATFCLPVREVLSRKSKNCSPTDFICDDDKEDCIAPDLHEGETFWVMKRKDHKDFLFIGSINDIYFGVQSVTDYLPKYEQLPLGMPLTIQTFLYYTASFSLALALINIIPCAMLDGQHAMKAIWELCRDKISNVDRISNCLIYTGTLLLFANLCITFIIMTWF